MIPAYALLRRSTTHQDLSISDQRAAVTAWAAANGYGIVREFADDGSGLDTAKRREFVELLQVCADPKRRQADVVLCYDVSRFSRLDPDEAAWHEHGLRRAGVRVIYTHDAGVNEDGVTGHLVKAIKRAGAHDYSLKLSQVVSRGLRSHAALGHWTGGRPSYGYRRAVTTATGTQLLPPGRWKAKGETVVLVSDPAEAAIVRGIFSDYVHTGHGLTKLTWGLNARGVPVPTGSRRHAVSKWTKGTVWALLRNPIYVGTLVYAKARYSELGKKRGKRRRPVTEHIVVEHAVEPLLDRALWDAAQRKHGPRAFGTGRPHHAYLLSGLIVCAHCGRRFRGHRQVGAVPYAVYICGSYHDSGPRVCDALSIRTDYLESVVIDGIQKRLDAVIDRAELGAKVRELLGPDERAVADVAVLEAALSTLNGRITALIASIGDRVPADLPSFQRVAIELERERERTERELASARARVAITPNGIDTVVDELLAALDRLPEVLAAGEPDARRAVVKTFLAGVRIEKQSRQAVLRWYSVPRLNDLSLIVVELRGEGLDPATTDEAISLPRDRQMRGGKAMR